MALPLVILRWDGRLEARKGFRRGGRGDRIGGRPWEVLLLLLLVPPALLHLARRPRRCWWNSVIHLILVVVDTLIAVPVLVQSEMGLTMASESSQLILNLTNKVSLVGLPSVAVVEEVLVLFEVVVATLLLVILLVLRRVSLKVGSLLIFLLTSHLFLQLPLLFLQSPLLFLLLLQLFLVPQFLQTLFLL